MSGTTRGYSDLIITYGLPNGDTMQHTYAHDDGDAPELSARLFYDGLVDVPWKRMERRTVIETTNTLKQRGKP